MTAPPSVIPVKTADRGRPRIIAALGTLVAFAILVSLGIWQLQRLTWKEGLLAEIDARIHAAPQPLPPQSQWASLEPDAYEYRHVTVAGTFEYDREALVFQGVSNFKDLPGPGYLVLTPLRLEDGSHVIVNRGFVPNDGKDRARRTAGETAGLVTITGLMREPEDRNPFTPADEPQNGLYFTRDPVLIASHFGLQGPAPFTIDEDALPVPGGLPRGGTTTVDIPNDHFGYALTWFGLAAALVGVYAASIFKRAARK